MDDARGTNMDKVDNLMAEHKNNLNSLASRVNAGGKYETELVIHYEGECDVVYDGMVVVKRPTVQDIIKIGVLKSNYIMKQAEKLGVRHVDLTLIDSSVKIIATWVAELSVVVVRCTPWFSDILNIEDLGLVQHVYDRYTEWLDSFRRPSVTKPDGDSQASQTEETEVDQEAL